MTSLNTVHVQKQNRPNFKHNRPGPIIGPYVDGLQSKYVDQHIYAIGYSDRCNTQDPFNSPCSEFPGA